MLANASIYFRYGTISTMDCGLHRNDKYIL